VVAAHLGCLAVTDPLLGEIVRQMRDWDGNLAPDSALAAVYQVTIRSAMRLLLDHHLGSLGRLVRGQGPVSGMWTEHSHEWFVHLLETPTSPWFDLGGGEQRDDVLERALAEAVETLKARLGPRFEQWSWGRLHRLTFHHPLGMQPPLDGAFNLGPFPIGGDGNTIWAASVSSSDGSLSSRVGPPYRFIADLGDLDHCWGLLAPGQSGHPASPHYSDGIRPWMEGRYHPILIRREEIERSLAQHMLIQPSA
jgi:penicillin amidase